MEEISFKEFLELSPPGRAISVSDLAKFNDLKYELNAPVLQIHCETEECSGIRFFHSENKESLSNIHANNKFITYFCRNCRKTFKTFSLRVSKEKDSESWSVQKYGELPNFGSPTPSRVFNLIGGERDLFFLGRKNENQGMGIGAFVYYRRVIESQKFRIFDEIIRVIKKIDPASEVIPELELAKGEVQFTKAVESLKHALPQSLFINGYNPLTLLHSALSEGVHAHSDEECLEFASSVRTVLFEFAERLGLALKEEALLNAAVSKLANKSKKS
jgi:hypothetical protein